MVELSVAFSVLIAFIVIGIVLFRIRERFDTVDDDALDRVRQHPGMFGAEIADERWRRPGKIEAAIASDRRRKPGLVGSGGPHE